MRRGNPFVVKRGPKGHKVTAEQLRAVRDILRAAHEKRTCYICKKRGVDAFVIMPVDAHSECVRREEKEARSRIDAMCKP